jgi:hypothetical protein
VEQVASFTVLVEIVSGMWELAYLEHRQWYWNKMLEKSDECAAKGIGHPRGDGPCRWS